MDLLDDVLSLHASMEDPDEELNRFLAKFDDDLKAIWGNTSSQIDDPWKYYPPITAGKTLTSSLLGNLKVPILFYAKISNQSSLIIYQIYYYYGFS